MFGKVALKSKLEISYNYISQVSTSGFEEISSLLNLLLFIFLESEAIMKLPYGYVLDGEKIVIHEERADAVRSIFEYYLAGASLGKIVEMLFARGISSPKGNLKWTRAAVDKLLANAKYIPIIGMETYMDVQFERDWRCNMDYDKAGHPRKAVRYRSPSIEIKCGYTNLALFAILIGGWQSLGNICSSAIVDVICCANRIKDIEI